MSKDFATLQRLKHEGRQILRKLQEETGIPVKRILDGRGRNMVALRLEFMYRAGKAGLSRYMMAKLLGRHHTTVLHHVHGWQERRRARAEVQ